MISLPSPGAEFAAFLLPLVKTKPRVWLLRVKIAGKGFVHVVRDFIEKIPYVDLGTCDSL